MQSDLRDSFEFFARGASHISRTDFESIIYNFGFKVLNSREKDAELVKLDSQFTSRSGFDYEFLEKVVIHRWYKPIAPGRENQNWEDAESFEAFRVFDTHERGVLKPSDFKRVFADYLDHPVTDQDI